MEKFKIEDVLPNENNPRYIRDEKFESLVKSIVTFPKMMQLRPITIDELNVTLGGNMRYEACKEINRLKSSGVKEIITDVLKTRNGNPETKLSKADEKVIKENLKELAPLFSGEFPPGWIQQEPNLTKEQKREFILKDNSSFGDWDYDALANQYQEWELEEAEIWTPLEPDYSLLDDLDDEDAGKIEGMEEGVLKAIQIEFNLEDYEVAKAIISKMREKDIYIGEVLIELFKKEGYAD